LSLCIKRRGNASETARAKFDFLDDPLITRRGAGFIGAAVAVFFVASTTRAGWVHLADALLWGTALLSFAVPFLSTWGIHATREFDPRGRQGVGGPIEGHAFSITIRLLNRLPLQRFMIAVRYPVSTPAGHASPHRFLFARLGAGAQRRLSKECSFERRGRVELGSLTVECSAPFGLFRRARQIHAIQHVLVHPRWVPIARVGLLDASTGADDGRELSRAGAELAGTRRYVSGDPWRHIHWRNSARTGHLMVKEFDARGDRAFVFLLDPVARSGTSEAFDDAVRLAATAARPLIFRGDRVLVAAGGRLSRIFSSWPELMAELALLEADPSANRNPLILPAGARVLSFIPMGAGDEAAALVELARRGHPAAAVLFTGYDSATTWSAAGERLTAAGIPCVECTKGALEAAAQAIERGLEAAGPARVAQRIGASQASAHANKGAAA
jgi:uncharacterized protein (DUF58 family)